MKHLRNQPHEYYRILVLRTVGNFLVLASIFMIIKTFYFPVAAEVRFALDSIRNKQYVAEGTRGLQDATTRANRRGGLAKLLAGRSVEVLTPQDPNFSIIIPKVGANSNVIPNVDAANEKQYLGALEHGVAHTLGTAFPGEGGHIYLFAHSTDYFWNVGTYNAVFYLIYKLEKGDEIDLFYKGQRYVYKVIGKQEVDPSQVQYLTRQSNSEFLTLQTCWPPGTTLRRLLVFATRVAE
ncbi:sortase [Candidatus Microgenomates bacterium]|nr:sortase [Candidatus Microgenomates bacterium]